ncbi:MAG: DUF58 domain-containing protein [Leptospirales bacterium]|jgi:uncharacterized protein (DUF58 family)
MFYPSNRFLILCLAPLALAFVAPVLQFVTAAPLLEVSEEFVIRALLSLDGLLLILFCLDAFTIPRRKRFRVERATDRVFSANFPHRVSLDIGLTPGWIRNRLRAYIADDAREGMDVTGFPHDARLKTGRNRIEYRLRVPRRGRYRLEKVYLSCFSILGLVRRVYRIPCETEIRVYPDLKAVSRYALLARKSHLGLIGIRRARRAGGDNEFERLRDYQNDDDFRHIDWKSTARQNRMIVRTYQMTQNQTIVFLLDCGRMMTAEFEGRSMLDYAMNSVLLLSHVALKQGDRVGFLAFASGVLRYVKPASGDGQHRRLVQACYDLSARHEESNYDLVFQYLNTVSRKRSLVTLVTNVIDDMNVEMMLAYLGALAGRHLPFAVLLKQREIQELADRTPRRMEDLFEQAAAADFLLWKAAVVQKLKNRSVLALESFPDQLDALLINEYLNIKARKLL